MRIAWMWGLMGLIGVVQAAASSPAAPRHGDWYAVVETPQPGGPRVCGVRHALDRDVRYDPVGTLVIAFANRGGLAGYRWRVDTGAVPGQARAPRAGVNDTVVISDVQNELSQGGVLLVSGVTRSKRSFELRYPLAGLAQAKADAFRMCGVGERP